mgnify:CR=1 FL=1
MGIPSLIQDLALILMVAGVVTLIFKKLKQPLVLGYIMAGVIVSPNLPVTMSVVDHEDIETWSSLGVMFLLFTLGLDFSFKKILKMGFAPIVASLTIVFCMMMIGYSVAMSFGWSEMNGLFLAGMLAMSSTTIIYKAFDDLGLMQQKFTSLVMSVLILEDILAIVLMVMLGAVGKGDNSDNSQLLSSVISIGFFLILWFVVGLFLVPTILRKTRKLMNDEVLLIFSLGLCCFMAVFATLVGFSSAFGAFVMGSILAETVDAKRIEKVVKPVKDLFGAIFFVSVGMLVDVRIIADQWLAIVVLTLAILIGQSIFGTFGYLISGQSLKSAMRCGFSMAQIGEFSFIIATLGLELGVISDFLYPVVVTVSVITTFLTPYMIRGAVPAYAIVERVVPRTVIRRIDRFTGSFDNSSDEESKAYWKPFLSQMLINVLIYFCLTVAVAAFMLTFVNGVIVDMASPRGKEWVGYGCTLITILLMSPFLRAIMVKKNKSDEFKHLWLKNRGNRAPLLATIVARDFLSAALIFLVIHSTTHLPLGVTLVLTFVINYLIYKSNVIKYISIRLERLFIQNLRSKDYAERASGKRRPLFEGHLLDRDIHISLITVPQDSLWAGKTLKELDLGSRFNVHVSSIMRGDRKINIPSGSDVIFPLDQLNVIGNDEQLQNLNNVLKQEVYPDTEDYDGRDMKLRRFVLRPNSPFVGNSLITIPLRDSYNCMLVGLEEGEENLSKVNPKYNFCAGDILWIVGEERDIKRLATEI